MFGFFKKLRAEVTQAVDSLHTRTKTLETRVDALFHHVTTNAVEAAVAAPEKAVEAVAKEVETKIETVATEVESKV